MLTEKPYSYLVDSLLPSYIVEDYPTYVQFIKRYFEALERDSGPVSVVNSISKFVDIDRVPDDFLEKAIAQYINTFPVEEFDSLNINNIIKKSKDFYSIKGTEKGLRFIFNLIGGSLEIYYPADDIFHNNISCLSGRSAAGETPEQLHYLHDNVYYAYWVYEIQSDQDIDKYQEIVEAQGHPIGTKVYYKQVI